MKTMKDKKGQDVKNKGMGQMQVVENYTNGGVETHRAASKVMMRGPGQKLSDKHKKATRGGIK